MASVIPSSPKATSVLRGPDTNGIARGSTNQAAPSDARVPWIPRTDVSPRLRSEDVLRLESSSVDQVATG